MSGDRAGMEPATSQMFGRAFYAAQAGLPGDFAGCVEHYLREGAISGLSPHPLFDAGAYLAANPDVVAGAVDPYFHFLTRGFSEGRRYEPMTAQNAYLSAMDVERLSGRRLSEQARRLGWRQERASEWAGRVVVVGASSLGRGYHSYLADRLAASLRADGVLCWRLDQNCERPRDVLVDFVVAPEEFFGLGSGRVRSTEADLARTILLNTAEPGTSRYFQALRVSAPESTLLDVCPQSAVVLEDLGLAKSGHLPIGWGPELEPADGARPIDVFVVGTLTTRRKRALARLAPTLAGYRCAIVAPTDPNWERAGHPHQWSLADVIRTARHSKCLLHLHGGEISWTDWTWMLQVALAQGAVAVSEPCLTFPGLEPQRHFVVSDLDELPDCLIQLLGPEHGARTRAVIGQSVSLELPGRFDLRMELRALAFLFNRGFVDRA